MLLALEADGIERFRIALADVAEAVVYNAHERQVWVATDHELAVYGDEGALVALSRRRLQDAQIVTDPRDGSVWIAAHKTLAKLNKQGGAVLEVELASETRDLALDPRTGEVWLTRRDNVVKLSPDGRLLLDVEPFGRCRDDDERPTRLTVDPATGSLWVASRDALAVVSASGEVARLSRRFRQIQDVAFFADLIAPVLEITFPAEGALIAASAPTVKLTHSDVASGIDPGTLHVEIDGQEISSTCVAVSGGSECLLLETLTLADGPHTVEAQVADRAGNTAEARSSFFVDTTPPPPPNEDLIEIEPGSQPGEWEVHGAAGSVEPGSTVVIRNVRTGVTRTVVAGPDGSFSLSIPAEPGDELEITATDAAGNRSTAVTKTVLAPPATTEASGFIHGTVRHSPTGSPLTRVIVSLRGLAGGVRTDASGTFTMPTPGTGHFTLFFESRGFITARRDQYVISQRHATVGEVSLTPYDPRTTVINAAGGGTLSDSTGKVQAIFPPGALSRDLEVSATFMSTEEVFPLPMPEGTVFVGGVQMTPEHTSFLKPVTLRIANDLGFDPGTPIPFAFASHDDHDPNEGFYDAGMARVTSDGGFIEMQVSHFSCVALGAAPPPGSSTGSGSAAGTGATGNQQPCNGNNSTSLSSICIGDGDVRTEQWLASVGALGGREALEFRYSSGTAFPRPIISAYSNLSTLYFATAPALATWKVNLEGVEREVAFQGATGETHFNFLWDGRGAGGVRMSTGAYHFKATSTGFFNGNLYTAAAFGGLPTTPTNARTHGLWTTGSRPAVTR